MDTRARPHSQTRARTLNKVGIKEENIIIEPYITVKDLLETNWAIGVTDPAKASIRFRNTFFDENGKIHTYQISVLSGAETLADIAMGSKPKYQGVPTVTVHVWVAVLPGKTIAQASSTRRNMLDEITRIVRDKATAAGNLSFLGQRITVRPSDELGETGPGETRRLHSIMDISGIYFVVQDTTAFIPTTILSTEWGADATRRYQRHAFFAKGFFWYFYHFGGQIYYITSPDGIAWSARTAIKVSSQPTSFVHENRGGVDYVHYANGDDSGLLTFYRRGTLNADRTITWQPEQTAFTSAKIETSLAVDELGFPWISWEPLMTPTTTSVTKSSTNDGIWNTAAGFPKFLGDTAGFPNMVFVSTSKLYRINNVPGFAGYGGNLYDSGTWYPFDLNGIGESIIGPGVFADNSMICALGNDVHAVLSDGTNIVALKRTYDAAHIHKGTWGPATILGSDADNPLAGGAGNSREITVSTFRGSVYAFYIRTKKIYYRKLTGTTWAAEVLLKDESSQGTVGMLQSTLNSDPLLLSWGTATPADIFLSNAKLNGAILQ